jgi:glycosyltransferase involved in cell wall biosynthesis
VNYRVTIYSPDDHITYDLNTLNSFGVGGGITNRVRIAHGLKSIGCEVDFFVNCPEDKTITGVNYIHFDRFDFTKECDIFIASTSGGNLNLETLQGNIVKARLKIILIHGIKPPENINLELFDYFYVPSNFIRNWISSNWKIEKKKIFTCHLGVNQEFFKKRIQIKNNFRLMYSGHPIKGLNSAISTLIILRKKDPRYTLWVFGSPSLWGEKEYAYKKDAGIRYFGTIGQKALSRKTQDCRFSLFLQDIPEAFGLSVIESMRAGCIPIASPVGAMKETITHGFNGLFVQGDHKELKTQLAAAEAISALSANQGYMDFLSENGKHSVLDWEKIAKIYNAHWDRIFDNNAEDIVQTNSTECPDCGGNTYKLLDGYHCQICGNLIRKYEIWN